MRASSAGWSRFLHNWRGDVVGLVTASGAPIQQMRYEPYGVAFGLPKCDLDGDGDVDAADDTLFDALFAASDVRADWNFDGQFTAADVTAFVADHANDADLGRGTPSYDYASAGGAVRKLYAGYEHDPALAGETYHVRHRVLLAALGRWSRRDPLGYVDGSGLYSYVTSRPLQLVDPQGLVCVTLGPISCTHVTRTDLISLTPNFDLTCTAVYDEWTETICLGVEEKCVYIPFVGVRCCIIPCTTSNAGPKTRKTIAVPGSLRGDCWWGGGWRVPKVPPQPPPGTAPGQQPGPVLLRPIAVVLLDAFGLPGSAAEAEDLNGPEEQCLASE